MPLSKIYGDSDEGQIQTKIDYMRISVTDR